MAGLAITRQELLALIEQTAREHREELRVPETGAWRQQHEEFCRRLSARLVETLARHRFAWARIPDKGDDLYRMLVAASNAAPSSQHVALTSEDPEVADTARQLLANEIIEFQGRTKIAIVHRGRRKA